MPPHPLTNFEIQMVLQYNNGVYSRNNLSKVKDGAYTINADEYESMGSHWVAWYVNAENVIYFDNVELNIFQKKLENLLKIKIL